MRHLKTILLILFLIVSVSVMGMRERNYIYLLDCTKSMMGYNGSPNIWIPTKDYFKNELKKHTSGTNLHIIPFQGNALPCISFAAENFNDKKWKEIDDIINGYVKHVTGTNICDAWDAIDKYIDLHKDNYIILLTDGKDTKNGMDAVARKLSNWCGKYPNTYAFYVQLTEAAIDQEIAKVIDICDNEFVIDASKGIPVFGSFDNGLIIFANTLNLKKTHLIGFSSAGKYSAKAICNDSYFDVKIIGNEINNGVVSTQIIAKKTIAEINAEIPETYSFTFDIQSNEVTIINPTIKVQMTNKQERSMETLSDETSLGIANWYDSFLFWGASNPDTLSVDLKTVFNDEAQKDGSSVEMQVCDPDGGNDFQLFFNNLPVEKNRFTLSSKAKAKSILSIVYNPDAREGTRYLSIKTIKKHDLDKINDQPTDQYTLSLRSKYEVTWNPLKTIMMWLGIFMIAALLLWFLFAKHFIYPTIGVKAIQISDPYFSKVNVKGIRRIVFTNKKMEQNILNRIFTGKILYKTNEVWTSPLAFEPGAKKRTLRVVKTNDYAFNPYTSTLTAPNEYIVENVNNKTKIKITIN